MTSSATVGSLVSRNGFGTWSNTNTAGLPSNAELVVGGRKTGYPNGLASGQAFQLVYKTSLATPTGTWTCTGVGNGSITVNAVYTSGGLAYSKTFAFVNGVCASPTLSIPTVTPNLNWTINLVASDASVNGGALRDVRFIMPGSDPVSGKTFVQLYAENASNPAYFLHHPDYLAYYKKADTVRTIDWNVNSQKTPPMQVTWADRTSNTQQMGYNAVRSAPVEQEVQLCNDLGRNLWHSVSAICDDGHIAGMAAYIRDNLDPRLKVYVEHQLEVWNWQYLLKYWCIARWTRETDGLASLTRSGTNATATYGNMGGRRTISGISRSGTTATITCSLHGLSVGSLVNIAGCNEAMFNGPFTVTAVAANTYTVTVANSGATAATAMIGGMFSTGHGLIVGDTVILTGAVDPLWNGSFTVASVPNLLSLTFTCSSTAVTPAVAIKDNHILAYEADSKVMPVDTGTLEFTMSTNNGYRGSFTATGHGLVNGDFVALFNCADSKANGQWVVWSVSGSTVSLVPCYISLRELPTDTVGSTPVAAAAGKTMMFRKTVANAGANGYPQSDDSAARWSARRHQQIHAIMRPILGSRLVSVIGAWYIDIGFDASLMGQYKADNGGSFTGDEAMAVAPYFITTGSCSKDIREDALNGTQKTISSITRSGTTATLTCNAHGYANGDTVYVYGTTQPEYLGRFVISNVTTNTFDYTVAGSPATPPPPISTRPTATPTTACGSRSGSRPAP